MTAAASERPRGRKPVFSDAELKSATRFAYARRVRSRRGAQDLVYRKFAIAVIEHYSEAQPESRVELEWLLRPTPRYSLLSELGRIAGPRSGAGDELEWSGQDVNRLIRVALDVARARPTTKAGVGMIRDYRRSSRRPRERSLLDPAPDVGAPWHAD